MIALGLMAKAPVPGQVKTRLSPPLSRAQCAQLAAAFIRDSWTAVAATAELSCALAYAGPEERIADIVPEAPRYAQRDGDLGARIGQVLRHGLDHAAAAIAIGSDTPGLPHRLLDAARSALQTHDAVLGPSSDGGYYLIGVGRWQSDLLAGLPWSSPDTLRATTARLESSGYSVAHIEPWFDVDDETDLRRLARAIDSGAVDAPATATLLREWQWR